MRAGLLLPFLAVAAGAGAQDLPPEGTFTVNFTAVDTAPGLPVNIGPDRAFGTYEAVMTASNAEGGGLLHNLTGRCTGWYVVDASAGSYEQHGHCNYADPDGDEIWERFDFDEQPLAPVRIASGRWIGGTGKYQGLRGEFEISVRPLRPGRDGVAQGIGTKQGSYRIAH